ncbi:NAD kinase [Enteractinococcus coprophilus]|uniref:NAD kinase n=1 Tax=Enteractinococcus coprophilus TaxID=1027633 RepID=A0A543AJW3_9MICC|nr:NAD kinase [Enteractinococcus coprophilus]TQL72878.1 NAD+ kinase [Enteractinococcus coprophilus]
MSRRVLILAHTGRQKAMQSALRAIGLLRAAGLTPVMLPHDAAVMHEAIHNGVLLTHEAGVEAIDTRSSLHDVELGMVLGGDGSVLRAAEMVRESNLPLMAVNLGHVGFLAEAEQADLELAVSAIVNKDYLVEERMTIDVKVLVGKHLVAHTWALNEASVEKSNRERMLEVVIGVDNRPISSFGCDGVVMATPTGSTAYAFSGGGPIVWPEVQAMLMVPLSAHALFARPLVVAPESVISVDVLQRSNENGVLWCDGRRTVDLPFGARIEATRSAHPVKLARLALTPFSERLVRKFDLPTEGWRGSISASDRAAIDARERARRDQDSWHRSLADSQGIRIVEPHHAAPRPDMVPPRTTPIPIVTKADEKEIVEVSKPPAEDE